MHQAIILNLNHGTSLPFIGPFKRLVNFNNYLKSLIPKSDRIKVFGPAPAPITKIRNRYRYKFLIKANKTLDIQKFIENWISGIKKPNSIRLSVDIDPYNFL